VQYVRAGSLKRRGIIQDRATTSGTYGEQSNTWTDIATVWMSIEPLNGRELAFAQQISTEVSHQIIVRYQTQWADPITMAKRRVTYRGRVFNIHAAMNSEESNVHIILLCSEGLNQG